MLMPLSLILLSLTSIFPYYSYAHEIYYDGYGPGYDKIPLKWFDVTNRKANLKINGDRLDSNYLPQYTIAKNAWPNASSRVGVAEASFSTSNVDLGTSTVVAWEDMWGYWGARSVLGICRITSTDGILLDSAAKARASSGKIKYASILFTPFNSFENTTHRRYTMVHELGHALGLGHPNTDYYVTNAASVMRTGSVESYYTPQAHDINDLNTKY